MLRAGWCFNPRTHEGCDTVTSATLHIEVEFQSTHPRRVRLRALRLVAQDNHVSIHAPTKGATGTPLPLLNTQRGFNPRTHEGCDLQNLRQLGIIVLFQSTHPRRVRPNISAVVSPSVLFQSTHPRRVRHPNGSRAHHHAGFNPRTHEGCDEIQLRSVVLVGTFQSTHPRRVRREYGCSSSPARLVSIHAPTKGATAHPCRYLIRSVVSIHAPTKGATWSICKRWPHITSFNPRTHEGCD